MSDMPELRDRPRWMWTRGDDGDPRVLDTWLWLVPPLDIQAIVDQMNEYEDERQAKRFKPSTPEDS